VLTCHVQPLNRLRLFGHSRFTPVINVIGLNTPLRPKTCLERLPRYLYLRDPQFHTSQFPLSNTPDSILIQKYQDTKPSTATKLESHPKDLQNASLHPPLRRHRSSCLTKGSRCTAATLHAFRTLAPLCLACRHHQHALQYPNKQFRRPRTPASTR
jgi:hypothetical protein